MTFENSTLSEILKSAFSAKVWKDMMIPALGATMYMLIMALIIMLIFGLILGMILFMTDKNGLTPVPALNNVLSAIVNALRSLPSMIMIIITIPLGRISMQRPHKHQPKATPCFSLCHHCYLQPPDETAPFLDQ